MHTSLAKLQAACSTRLGKARAALFYPVLEEYLPLYGIASPECEIMFLSQVLHESAEFKYTKELGSMSYLDKYDTGTLAARLGNSPEDDDDGIKYCGRGIFQLTGLDNYKRFSKETGVDVVNKPEYLESVRGAVHSACWFWFRKELNKLCPDIRAVTRKINGGYNGLEDRIKYFNRFS
jgi:putative chitinase